MLSKFIDCDIMMPIRFNRGETIMTDKNLDLRQMALEEYNSPVRPGFLTGGTFWNGANASGKHDGAKMFLDADSAAKVL